MPVKLPKGPVSVDEYYRLAEIGVLDEDSRVELLDGEIIEMSPIGRRHASMVDRLTYLFSQLLQGSAIVRVQNPLRLGEFSEPVPDLCLLSPRTDFYADAHPGPADALLVVEVAE